MQNNTTHFLSEFISNNTETFREILPHKAPFVRVHIKQYWHFRRAATKQYFTNFSEFIWHNTISGSYYKMILHIFSEFISNNIDTSIVTTKHYSKIILFCKFYQTKMRFSESCGQMLQIFFHRGCTRQYFFLSQMWTNSKSLLIWINEKSTFRKLFDFKKLKIVYCWDVYFFYDYNYLPLSNKSYQPEKNFTRPFNVMPRTVACNSIS